MMIIQQNSQSNSSNILKLLPLLIIGLFSLLFSSCEIDTHDELSNKINIALRNDNKIDEKEWTEFSAYIFANERDFTDLIFPDKNINVEALTSLIIDIANKRRGKDKPEIFNPEKTEQITSKPVVNFYIENSGSMDGYVRGIKDFETVVANLLVKSKDFSRNNENANFNIHLINKAIFPVPQVNDLISFAQSLDPKPGSIFKQTGKTGESEINRMVEMVLNKTGKDTLSIFISDCIYSIDSKKDTRGSLAYQQAGALDAFLNKLRNNKESNFTTAVFKFTSGFEGKYYAYDNSNEWIDDRRPYYIWILGENTVVEKFINSIKIEEQIGYNNSYVLSDFRKIQPYYTILKETNKVGSFKQTDRNEKDLKSINSLVFDNGTLQFSIAIDLGNIPVDSTYLTNPQNFTLTDGFTIKAIEKIDRNKISQRDYITIEKTTATHIITVTTSNKYSVQDLKLGLSNKIPSWVEESNSIDDRDIKTQLDKTFGLLYLIQGVSEAYKTINPDQKFYFEIVLNIKK
jgi:hypothetical protein